MIYQLVPFRMTFSDP